MKSQSTVQHAKAPIYHWPLDSHARAFLRVGRVCRELRAPDLNIEHILADGSIETNSAAEKRLMSMLHIRPDMIQNEHDCIEQAYETQASNIAYLKPSKKSYSEPRNLHDENIHDRLHE